ncbi:hypothetical protein [Amycolatopsis nigrescens]|uniref:hypothetical protein n=1 Tax=Amycolatopsis nigrescens TaxID=381445 RepID=UPI00039E6469|nr:hypothetical protein [Amycolatopsis nigrescens]
MDPRRQHPGIEPGHPPRPAGEPLPQRPVPGPHAQGPGSGYQRPVTDPRRRRSAVDSGFRSPAEEFHPRRPVADSGYQRPVAPRPQRPGTDSGYQRPMAKPIDQHPATDFRRPVAGPGPQPSISTPRNQRPAGDTRRQRTATGPGPQAVVRDSGEHRPVTDSGYQRPVTESGVQRSIADPESSVAESAEQAPTTDVTESGYQRALSGETGSHRAVGKAARRRVAKWPIACLVLVVLAGLGWAGWGWLDGVANSRAEAQASSCAEGDANMRVIVTPSAEQPVAAAAAKWNQANTVVHAHCVRIEVQAMPSERVLNALTGRSNIDAIGGMPAGWIPESSFWVDAVTTAKPEIIGSPAESVASSRGGDYPFLGLSGGQVDDVQKRASQVFRNFLKEPAQQGAFGGR